MNRLNQVKMSQTNRRFGLPQVGLLTGAFATAVLLALVLRPTKTPPLDVPPPVIAAQQQTAPVVPAETEREAAQSKLAAAMARFANAPTKEPEAPAAAPSAQAPVPAASPPVAAPAPAPEPPAPAARVVDPQAAIAPAPTAIIAPAPALRPTLPPLSDADMRRLGDKAAQAIRDGDIYGARLILERAIEAGDGNALLALAETYDPKGLARMNVKSVKGDPVRARALYTQALEKGVTAARARLDALDR